MFVIVAWIGPFNRIGIILSIITILCLLFFPYKRNPFYDLQKDGIDMMKKGFRKFFGQVDHIGRYKRIDHKLNERGFEENENKM